MTFRGESTADEWRRPPLRVVSQLPVGAAGAMTTYFCKYCGWQRTEPVKFAMCSKCDCGKGLHFVNWDVGEFEEVDRLVGGIKIDD